MNEFFEYEKQHSRFFYSYITQYIFDEENDEKIGRLLGNLNGIIDIVSVKTSKKCTKNSSKENDLSKLDSGNKEIEISHNKYLMIFKLYDHCNLATKQRLAYKKTKNEMENRIAKIARSKIKEYEKSITSQLIGLVAIFTALSFVLFGGISSFNSIFQMTDTTSLIKIFIILDIWFICMFNLFAFFMEMIAMITDKQFKIKKYLLIIDTVLSITLIALILLHYCSIA